MTEDETKTPAPEPNERRTTEVDKLHTEWFDDEEKCGGCHFMTFAFYSLEGPVTIRRHTDIGPNPVEGARPLEEGETDISGVCSTCMMELIGSYDAGVALHAFTSSESESKPLGIKRWIRSGRDSELDDVETDSELLEAAGRLLDKGYAGELVGEVLFEGDDGKMYCGCVEFMITEANQEYVADVLAEEGLDGDTGSVNKEG